MPQLGGGGAERVVSIIIRYLNSKKYTVYLILIHNEGDYLSQLPQEVIKIPLKASQTRYALFELLKILRFLKPDIVFSSLRGISLLLSIIKPFLSSNTKLIFREENTPSVAIKESKFPKSWKLYYNTLFQRADYIICQSDYMVKDFKENFKIKECKITRIYNPVDINMIENKLLNQANPYPNNQKKNVVVVSRMSHQKGIDIFLQSIAKNIEKTNHLSFWLVGDGEEIIRYKNLARKLGIDGLVMFVGRSDNPFVWMKYADLFVLPSRYEGLPNVLLEAIVSGCKSIVTSNHPGGTREIMGFIDKENYIVEELTWESSWFSQEIEEINYGRIYDIFNVDNIIKKYEFIFDKVGTEGFEKN